MPIRLHSPEFEMRANTISLTGLNTQKSPEKYFAVAQCMCVCVCVY